MNSISGKYQVIIDHIPLQIAVVDLQMRLKEMNACFRETFSRAAAGDDFFTVCFDEPLTDVENHPLMRAKLSGNEEMSRISAACGGRLVQLEVCAVPVFDKHSRLSELICINTDITKQIASEREAQRQRERYKNILVIQDGNVDRLMHMQRELANKSRELERKNEELQQMTLTDALTGLNNRRAFAGIIEREVRRAERYRHPLSIIFFDIDNFRDFNNNYDYDTGDAVLRVLVQVTRSVLRDTDIITRYGGEEFVAVLPETDFSVVNKIAERLRKAVALTKVKSKYGELSVTVSIGTSTICQPVINSGKLLNLAVEALHEAKQSGRNHTVSKEFTDKENNRVTGKHYPFIMLVMSLFPLLHAISGGAAAFLL